MLCLGIVSSSFTCITALNKILYPQITWKHWFHYIKIYFINKYFPSVNITGFTNKYTYVFISYCTHVYTSAPIFSTSCINLSKVLQCKIRQSSQNFTIKIEHRVYQLFFPCVSSDLQHFYLIEKLWIYMSFWYITPLQDVTNIFPLISSVKNFLSNHLKA